MNPDHELVVVDDIRAPFASLVIDAWLDRPNDTFAFALSGGDTARRCYEQLAEDAATAIDWWKVDVYWGDERCVPHDHEDSNYRLAREALLDRVGAANATHLMRCAEVDDYQLRIGDLGKLDLIHLGMGPDGHTASLFPRAASLAEALSCPDDYVSVDAAGCPGAGPWPLRISQTPAGMQRARRRLLLLRGRSKRELAERALAGEDVLELPVRVLFSLPGEPLQIHWCP